MIDSIYANDINITIIETNGEWKTYRPYFFGDVEIYMNQTSQRVRSGNRYYYHENVVFGLE